MKNIKKVIAGTLTGVILSTGVIMSPTALASTIPGGIISPDPIAATITANMSLLSTRVDFSIDGYGNVVLRVYVENNNISPSYVGFRDKKVHVIVKDLDGNIIKETGNEPNLNYAKQVKLYAMYDTKIDTIGLGNLPNGVYHVTVIPNTVGGIKEWEGYIVVNNGTVKTITNENQYGIVFKSSSNFVTDLDGNISFSIIAENNSIYPVVLPKNVGNIMIIDKNGNLVWDSKEHNIQWNIETDNITIMPGETKTLATIHIPSSDIQVTPSTSDGHYKNDIKPNTSGLGIYPQIIPQYTVVFSNNTYTVIDKGIEKKIEDNALELVFPIFNSKQIDYLNDKVFIPDQMHKYIDKYQAMWAIMMTSKRLPASIPVNEIPSDLSKYNYMVSVYSSLSDVIKVYPNNTLRITDLIKNKELIKYLIDVLDNDYHITRKVTPSYGMCTIVTGMHLGDGYDKEACASIKLGFVPRNGVFFADNSTYYMTFFRIINLASTLVSNIH